MSDDRITGEIGEDAHTNAIGKDIKQDVHTTNVNVYPTSGKPRRTRARKPSSMVATVDERVLFKLNEHDAKLIRLEIYREADQKTALEIKEDLRKDIEEIKRDLKPLFGQGILAQPQPSTDKEEKEQIRKQNRLVLRVWIAILIVLGLGLISFIGFIVWLALNQV